MTNTRSRPLFTVIIPTKDRAEYLYHTLRTCSNQDYENLEVIVSDDGSSDNTKAVVLEAARKDPRIRYVTPGSSLGMRDNFEFALDRVKPGYVIALGGDDGILPYGISGMWRTLQGTGKDLLTWRPLSFTYPSESPDKGLLAIFRHGKSKILRSSEYLERQAKNLNYLYDFESPMFYIRGVVATRLIELVRSRTPDGRFFVCNVPDGFSAIALAGEAGEYAVSATPFTIAGNSPASQGRAFMAEDKQARKLADSFYRGAAHAPMHRDLASQPFSPLIALLTADFLLTAKDLPGWPGRVPLIDYKSLLLKGLNELGNGLYATDRINRELTILDGIAQYHGIEDFFRAKVKQIRRHQARRPFAGNAITPRHVLLDCNMFEIHNIFDAAYVSWFVCQLLTRLNFAAIEGIITGPLKYKLQEMRKGQRFPPETEWVLRGSNT